MYKSSRSILSIFCALILTSLPFYNGDTHILKVCQIVYLVDVLYLLQNIIYSFSYLIKKIGFWFLPFNGL